MSFSVARKTFSVCLFAFTAGACSSLSHIARSAAPAASPSPASTPKPAPYIAYLYEGDLWLIRGDGTDQRVAVAAPEGETIQDFVWAADGSRLYYSIGSRMFEVIVQNGNLASAGKLNAGPEIAIDRMEMGRDGETIVIQALNADASTRLFALKIGGSDSRELSVDEYASLISPRLPVIRAIGAISVSPDGRMVLFKDVVEDGEERFVADTETGARIKVTSLYELGGFEESVETEGGRRVIEATWSPDGRRIIFNPMQSCSEAGLCYGRLFLVDAWGGAQLQLSYEMMIDLPGEWSVDNKLLVYDDGSRIVIADTNGNPTALANGNHPKWQP